MLSCVSKVEIAMPQLRYHEEAKARITAWIRSRTMFSLLPLADGAVMSQFTKTGKKEPTQKMPFIFFKVLKVLRFFFSWVSELN